MGTPGFGVQGTGYPAAGEWGVTFAWRYQKSDKHFVGSDYQEIRDELGNQVINHVNLADLTVRYQATKRIELSAGLPYFMGTRSQTTSVSGGPLQRYQTAARGLGDIFLTTHRWMFDPDTHPGGNLQLGIGIKIPTGQNNYTDTFKVAQGNTLTNQIRTVDQSIQPGDGGFGILVDFNTFTAVAGGKLSLYAGGAYLSTPAETSGVQTYRTAPGEEVMSIADQYLARGGAAFGIPKLKNTTFSGGLRLEGVRAGRERDHQGHARRHARGAVCHLSQPVPKRAGHGKRRARRRGVCRLPDPAGLLATLLIRRSKGADACPGRPGSRLPCRPCDRFVL
jgi:hypothetical protein